MTRGLRGATTVVHNESELIYTNTRLLVEEMIKKNSISPENVSHVFISVTNDLDAGFPARAIREISGWSLVPVMCMKEIEVPNSLKKCIRIMMVIRTNKGQDEMHHVFLNEAVQLRPDLVN